MVWRVTVQPNVGLEHNRWLGPTVRDIAEEKLAVLKPGTTLVLGSGLDPAAQDVAARVAGERGARILRASPPAALPPVRARWGFHRANFPLAPPAAEAYPPGDGT